MYKGINRLSTMTYLFGSATTMVLVVAHDVAINFMNEMNQRLRATHRIRHERQFLCLPRA